MVFRCPGKLFFLGEYAVLKGSPAWLYCGGPDFALFESGDLSPEPHDQSVLEWHPESPAMRWLTQIQVHLPSSKCDEIEAHLQKLHWRDPFFGQGGWGASTAQWILLNQSLKHLSPQATRSAWREYRELHSSGTPPSGADLVAQLAASQTGQRWWRVAMAEGELRASPCAQPAPFLGACLTTSGQGRKTATHAHLADQSLESQIQSILPALQKLQSDFERCLLAAPVSSPDLGKVLNHWSHTLNRAGLECKATQSDLRELRSLPGILGAKGAGALQSDALWVIAETREALQVFRDWCDRKKFDWLKLP
jgi:hypothetical protein